LPSAWGRTRRTRAMGASVLIAVALAGVPVLEARTAPLPYVGTLDQVNPVSREITIQGPDGVARTFRLSDQGMVSLERRMRPLALEEIQAKKGIPVSISLSAPN